MQEIPPLSASAAINWDDNLMTANATILILISSAFMYWYDFWRTASATILNTTDSAVTYIHIGMAFG